MESSSVGKWYVKINGEAVEITNEVHLVIRADTEKYRRAARNEKRCAQANYQKCQGDCYQCQWHRQGIYTSIDQFTDKTPLSLCLSDNETPESIMEQRDSWSYLCSVAERVTLDGALLLNLRFDEGKTTSEIAEILMISRQAVEKRLHRILEYFRENLKDFF